MQKHAINQLFATIVSTILLAFSASAAAADWTWVDEEIANSNFGQAAGWVILSVDVVAGEEYLAESEDGIVVCRDYEITVAKERAANPAGRGKFQSITETELETYCQPLEEEVLL